MKANAHRVCVRLEHFCFCHQFYGVANAAHTIFCQMLERNLTTIAVQIYAIICGGIAVCRQCVVGAAGIVAGTLTSVCSEEHATWSG